MYCYVPDNNLGYSWAAFLLACIAYVLAIIRRLYITSTADVSDADMASSPAFVLFRYGSRIRARSPAAILLARQLEEAERKREERLAARREKAAQRAAAGLDAIPASEKKQVA